MSNIKELEAKYIELGQEIERLKKECEVKYPLYFRNYNTGSLIKFDGLTSGAVVVQGTYLVGYTARDWTAHTHTSTWQPIPVCPKTGFFHGQLVWCWNEDWTHIRSLRLWNAINSMHFGIDGGNSKVLHDHIEPFTGEYPQWALDAQKEIYAKLESK